MIIAKTEFEQILIENYFDGDSLVSTVRKFDFENDLYSGFVRLQSFIESGELSGIPKIIGAILVTINDKLRTVTNKEEKIVLEEIARTTFEGQIFRLKSTEEGKECLRSCTEILRETCDLKGYNFESLNKILKLEQMILIPINYSDKITSKHYHYDWCSGKLSELDDLAADLKGTVIVGVINFKRMFSPIMDNNFSYNGYQSKLADLVILFSILKELKLIKPRGTSGHFAALERYGVDNGKKLFGKKPNKVLEHARRSSVQYQLVYNRIRATIERNCTKSIEIMKGQ